MKRIILSTVAILFLITAHAQQQNNVAEMRQRLAELNSETDPNALEKKLRELQNSNGEEDYLIAYNYYSAKFMTDKADEIRMNILEKFPEGRLAQYSRLQEIQELPDLDQKDQRFAEIYQKYADADYGDLPFILGREFATKGNEERMKFYADLYAKSATDGKGDPITPESIYALMARGMVQSNPQAAAGYLKYGVDQYEQSLDRMQAEPDANPGQSVRAKRNYFVMLASYIDALTLGNDAEQGYALAFQTYQTLKSDTSNPATEKSIVDIFEKTYVRTLTKTKRYKEALPFMEEFVRKGESGGTLMDELETAYYTVNGKGADFVSYQTGLLSQQKSFLDAELAEMAINTPAHDFELKDVDGKVVKLSDYKGKVVVLDFWATWCGPCKASFPAMQKSVNKYKSDPNVQFLFLHTWERGSGDATQEAKKYITDNHYGFEVLMDLRGPDTKASAVATAYNVKGIPAKFIIDTYGNIRFSTSGFSADEDKAVEELSNMIEFARKGS